MINFDEKVFRATLVWFELNVPWPNCRCVGVLKANLILWQYFSLSLFPGPNFAFVLIEYTRNVNIAKFSFTYLIIYCWRWWSSKRDVCELVCNTWNKLERCGVKLLITRKCITLHLHAQWNTELKLLSSLMQSWQKWLTIFCIINNRLNSVHICLLLTFQTSW